MFMETYILTGNDIFCLTSLQGIIEFSKVFAFVLKLPSDAVSYFPKIASDL